MESNLISRYVERHNAGVRTGSFGSLMELFHPEAVMTFIGIPAGPFRGVDEIASAFRATPPDDELVVTIVEESEAGGVALYGWLGSERMIEGWLAFDIADGLIVSLKVIRERNDSESTSD